MSEGKSGLLRNRLNEFQLDWAQAPVRSEQISLQKMRGKKFLLIGRDDSLLRAVQWSLEAWNDECRADVSVKCVIVEDNQDSGILRFGEEKSESAPHGREDGCKKPENGGAQKDGDKESGGLQKENGPQEKNAARADGRKNLSDSWSEAAKQVSGCEADYVILTGWCCREVQMSAAETMEILEGYFKLTQVLTKLKCERILLLSDGRVYGKLDSQFAASEYEAGKTDPCALGFEEQYFLQALESMLIACARENGASYQILRTGKVFGAYIRTMEHSVYTLARLAADGEEASQKLCPERNSYISIHDVLTAVQFVLTKCPANKIFNVTGERADASDGELVMMLYQNFPQQCRISLNWEAPKGETGILLNTQLIRRYGFVPQVSLEDGLIILVKCMQNLGKVFIFDNTYLGKLTKVQQILLGYLLEIDRICKKHGIRYFLAGGTLLGAIRHHGFIPWDDDADVMMLREDYDHFLKVVQDEVPDNIFLQLPYTEKGNHNPFTKLRINNTMFATEFTSRFLHMHNGIFFDVLSHDQTGNHKWSQKLHLMMTMLTRSIVFNKWGNTNIKSGGKHELICKIVSKAKKFIPMPFAEWAQERSLRFFQNRKSEYLYDGMGRNLKRGAFPKAWLDETVYVEFEGYQFPVPKEYDKYLTYLYGDYMQMIPVSHRRTSHSILLTDLGEYSAYQCPGAGKDQEKTLCAGNFRAAPSLEKQPDQKGE